MTKRFFFIQIFAVIFFNLIIVAQTGDTLNTHKNQERTISFAGIDWFVRNGVGGPGPNNWYDDDKSVWVDANGYLHMKIREINNVWYCSEIYTPNTYGYNEYLFYLASDVTLYDVNAIVGLFLYQDDTHEIDIEFSKWGIYSNNIGWYSVQPVTTASQSSFGIGSRLNYTSHKIIWTAQHINFQSYVGNCSTIDSSSSIIKNWTYTGPNNPVPQSETLHINFWLLKGMAPQNLQEMEVVIKAVKISPVTGNITINHNSLTDFQLEQNFPNPFNPSTTINYSVPESSFVHLKVYDILGNEVATLVNENKKAGEYSVKWNGLNSSGTQVSSGIYFYRISAGSFIQVKKMVFMK